MFSLRSTLVLGFASWALVASPAAGEMLKFEQLPLNNGQAPSTGGANYPGSAPLSTANPAPIFGWEGTAMGDDFALDTSERIVHVQWWGRYLDTGNGGGVQRFLISFETDIAATESEASHPGVPILSQFVTLGPLAENSGTFTEAALGGGLYQYDAQLEIPMIQNPDQVFWIKIVAMVNPTTEGNVEWGWQSRDWGLEDTLASTVPSPGEHLVPNGLGEDIWHFQDAAVTSEITIIPVPLTKLAGVSQQSWESQNYTDTTDGPTGINAYGRDMAFRLYVMPVPEPASIAILGAGGLALVAVACRRRRRRR